MYFLFLVSRSLGLAKELFWDLGTASIAFAYTKMNDLLYSDALSLIYCPAVV
jgi:hypothetical protein